MLTAYQMMKGRRSLNDSRGPSPEGSEDEARSPASNDENDLVSPTESKTGSVRGRKPRSNFLREEFKKDPMDLLH